MNCKAPGKWLSVVSWNTHGADAVSGPCPPAAVSTQQQHKPCLPSRSLFQECCSVLQCSPHRCLLPPHCQAEHVHCRDWQRPGPAQQTQLRQLGHLEKWPHLPCREQLCSTQVMSLSLARYQHLHLLELRAASHAEYHIWGLSLVQGEAASFQKKKFGLNQNNKPTSSGLQDSGIYSYYLEVKRE